MQNAIKAVELGDSIRHAAEMFNVPRSTLHNKVTGKTDVDVKPGPDPYLTFEEEEELASFLIQTAKIGYPHTKNQVLALVQQIVDSKGIDTTVINGWWERYRQRHPRLTLKSAVPLTYARAMATDQDVLNRYFDILESCWQNNSIYDSPGRIFNCDETGLPLCPKSLKVVGEVGHKTLNYVTGNSKSQITVLACTSAAGFAIPPFVIFARKTLNPELTKGEVPGTLYGLSENGWVNRDLFQHWLLNHFLIYAPPSRPILLLLDGHSSHYCPEAIRLAAENKIILFALPPHTTHLTQPLDKGCFGPLKIFWRQLCHQFCAENPGRTVTQYDFSKLFAAAWYKAFTMTNIISSFRVTGVCPFNRSVIKIYTENDDENDFTSFRRNDLAQRTGLAYVPLYTPTRGQSSPVQGVQKSISSTPYYEESCIVSPLHEGSFLDSSSFEPSRMDVSVPNPRKPARDLRATSVPVQMESSISKFLIPPIPPSKMPTKRGKAAGTVLTSKECLIQIQERERKKQENCCRKKSGND